MKEYVIMRSLSWISLGVGLATACDRSDTPLEPVPAFVTLLTVGDAFQAGPPLPLIIVNHSSSTIRYNLCYPQLELLTERGWHNVTNHSIGCTETLRSVPPASRDTAVFFVPAGASPGAYRVRFDKLHVGDGLVPREQLTTNLFAVH
jgi:hypothetical protein